MTGLEATEQQATDEIRERKITAFTTQGSETQAQHVQNELKWAMAVVEAWLQSQIQFTEFDTQRIKGLFT